MARTLIIGCAHGMGGTNAGWNDSHNPRVPWLTPSNSSRYDQYLRESVVCQSDKIGAMVKWGYLFKACIDAGIELKENNQIDEFRIFFSRGTFFGKTEKWMNLEMRDCIDEEFENPFVIAVGKSFGGFDIVRGVSGIGRKRKYRPIDTDLMILIDPDESLDTGNSQKNIIPTNVKRVINFTQNQTTGPLPDMPEILRGHLVGPVEGNEISQIENISFDKDTHFPPDAEVFPNQLLNHWTIDEYIPVVGYNGWTLASIIVKGTQGELPPSLTG